MNIFIAKTSSSVHYSFNYDIVIFPYYGPITPYYFIMDIAPVIVMLTCPRQVDKDTTFLGIVLRMLRYPD